MMLNQNYLAGGLKCLSWIEDEAQGILRNAITNLHSETVIDIVILSMLKIHGERYLFCTFSCKTMGINLVTFFHGNHAAF